MTQDDEIRKLAKIAAEAIKAGHPINRLEITARRYDGLWSRQKIARDAAKSIARRVAIVELERKAA